MQNHDRRELAIQLIQCECEWEDAMYRDKYIDSQIVIVYALVVLWGGRNSNAYLVVIVIVSLLLCYCHCYCVCACCIVAWVQFQCLPRCDSRNPASGAQ